MKVMKWLEDIAAECITGKEKYMKRELRKFLGNYFPSIAWEEKSLFLQGDIIRG